MAELILTQDETPGIMKEIDEGAIDLVFSALQEDIYSYPIKSFVREAISNGLDAITEREIAYKIHTGTPEDTFYRQQQDGKLLKDSAYDKSYYDWDHLSNDSIVYVKYIKSSEKRRHTILIQDFGVGLGGSRLQGFFKLGYSSKRNLKDVFGKFGSGAKAALATGVGYFLMHTVYNGYKTSFMIFKTDYEAIIPASDTTKSESWDVRMVNGDISTRNVHWEPTNEKNSVTIELEVKAHNENAYNSAVIEQFQHFKGKVRFDYQLYTDSVFHTNTLDRTPLYESESILISEYATYYSPVLLLDGISYGPISWGELELETRKGMFAIKAKTTDVDITQSRESVKYTERTKKVILNAIKTVEKEASEYLADKMEVQDSYNVFELLDNRASIQSDAITKAFASFLNVDKISVNYTFNPEWFEGQKLTVKAGSELFKALFYNYKIEMVTVNLRGGKAYIKSTPIDSFKECEDAKIVFAEKSYLGPKTANQLLSKFKTQSLIYIRPNTKERMSTTLKGVDYHPSRFRVYAREVLQRACDLYLDAYEYNEDVSSDMEDGAEAKLNIVDLAKLRRLNSEVLYRIRRGYRYSLDSVTIKIADLKEHLNAYDSKIVLCTQEYKDWGYFIEEVSGDINHPVKVLYVAKDVLRTFLPYGEFITDYIRKYDKAAKTLLICKELRVLNTQIICKELQKKYDLSNISVELALKLHSDLKDSNIDVYTRNYYPNLTLDMSNTIDSFIADLNLIDKMKRDVTIPAKETKAVIKDCFKVSDITHLDAYDAEFIATYKEALDKISTIKPIYKKLNNDISFEEIEFIQLIINTLNNNKK